MYLKENFCQKLVSEGRVNSIRVMVGQGFAEVRNLILQAFQVSNYTVLESNEHDQENFIDLSNDEH